MAALFASSALAIVTACTPASVEPEATPTPVPTPTPTPEPPAESEIISSFLDLIQDPEFSFHSVTDGTVRVVSASADEAITIGMDFSVVGEDGVGEAVLDVGPSNITIELLVLDDHGYVLDDGDWVEVPDLDLSTPLNPFANLTEADDVAFDRTLMQGRLRVHALSSHIWLGADLATLEDQGWSDLEIENSLTRIVVDDDGTPLSMTNTGVVTGTYEGEFASISLDVTYQFSDVGEPVELPEPS